MDEIIKSQKGFYVGDICYALSDDDYNNIWGKQHNYADGKFAIRGSEFCVAETAEGDGCYYDNKDRQYGVDAGVIGIIPLELIEEPSFLEGGNVFNGTEAQFIAENGKYDIVIKNGEEIEYIHISTTYDDDEDEDYIDFDCPYCHDKNIFILDYINGSTKCICRDCDKDFIVWSNGTVTDRHNVPIK